MTGSDAFAKILRLQDTLVFKVVASIVVVAFAVTALSTYVVRQYRVNREEGLKIFALDAPREDQGKDASTPEQADPAKAAAEDAERERARSADEADARYYNDVLSARTDWTGVAIFIGEMTALVLALIWLGLGLSGLGLLALLSLIAWRLKLFRGQFILLEELTRFDTVLLFIGAVAVLTVSFLVLMQLLKLAFSSSHPVTAVARNVVHEAVRLKISLVFIVLLIFVLAALPGLLNSGTPLRYRVQAFLSYGTSGTFWIIAILTVFLSVGSVSFEQRDRIIWQTMTKPVAAWQYILGKWLGVVGVAAVLLTVSASGIFVFTDFLWRQKAVDESAPFVSRGEVVSSDRDILQTQVLTARITKKPEPPQELNEVEFDKKLQQRVENFLKTNPTEVPDLTKLRQELTDELRGELATKYYAIEPGQHQTYMFRGLEQARKNQWLSPERYARKFGKSLEEVNQEMADNKVQSKVAENGQRVILSVEVRSITLRYKVQSGGNDPRSQIRLTFLLQNQPPKVNVVSLNSTSVLPIPPSAVAEDGNVYVRIFNGDVFRRTVNPGPVFFPPDGLEVRVAVGGYQMNFFRVMLIQWLKLMFLAMAAIAAATFLSFPVASIMAFGVLLVAESAGFIHDSLQYYDATVDGKFDLFRFIVRMIALPIAWIFKYYADINPIENLADGKLVSWMVVLWAATIMLGTCLILYGIGVGIFRKRELATYSGQ